MPQIGLDGWVGFLVAPSAGGIRHCSCSTHLVQAVGKRILATGGSTEDLPVVYNELVSTWGGLSLGNNLERAVNFDSGFQRERERFICLRDLPGQNTLEVASAIPEDDENDLFLIAQPMNPSRCANAL